MCLNKFIYVKKEKKIKLNLPEEKEYVVECYRFGKHCNTHCTVDGYLNFQYF